jgi:hypothetical protein
MRERSSGGSHGYREKLTVFKGFQIESDTFLFAVAHGNSSCGVKNSI